MARTLDAMGRNNPGNPALSVPAEYARAEWAVENAPSATALKMLSVIFAAAGNDLAAPIDVPLSDLRAVPRVIGLSVGEIADELRGLMLAHVAHTAEVSPGVYRDRFGPILGLAEIDRSEAGLLALRVQFGPAFIKLAAESDVYALLDRAQLLKMRSRYSVLLYQFAASHWRKNAASVRLSMGEWRRVFGLGANDYPRFATANQRVFAPAAVEVSRVSGYRLTWRREYEGRAVVALVLQWERPAVSDGSKPAKPVAVKAAPKRSKDTAAALDQAALHEEILQRLAERILAGSFVSGMEKTDLRGRELLERGLVSAEVLRRSGFSL